MIYSNGKSFEQVASFLSTFASENGFTIQRETTKFASSPSTTSQAILLNGHGVEVLVESALMEACAEKEGRRDVEYSSKVFDVAVFSTSFLAREDEVVTQVQKLRKAVGRNGLRVVTKPELCGLL